MAGQMAAGRRQGRRWVVAAAAAVVAVVAQSPATGQTGPTLTPARFGFGTVVVGDRSSTQAFTFSSSVAMTVNTVSVSGEFVLSDTNCVGRPVTSCVSTVVFAPASEGAKTGVLTIAFSDSGVSASLSGNGGPRDTTSVAPTTTSTGPTTSTTATATSTTSTRATSTTVARTTTTTTIPVAETAPPETTLAPTTTTTSAPPPPAASAGPTLDAVASHGRRSGPPGVGLAVSGRGYGTAGESARGRGLRLIAAERAAGGDCSTVYVFLDGQRIGSVRPDAGGEFHRAGWSVPGGTGPGGHAVTSACHPSGSPVLASSPFEVTGASLHRTAFATSLPRVADIDFSGGAVLASVAAVLGLLFLIAFPAELFNTTLEEHYDEVRGWFHLSPRPVAGGRHHGALLVLFLLLSGPLWFSMQAGSGLDAATAAGALGLSAATAVVVLASDLPEVLHVRRRYHERATPIVLPGSLLMALGCVVLSRAVHFQPGYFYGLVGGLALARALERDESGRLAARASAALLALSVISWLLLQPVAAAARETGTSLPSILIENLLGGIFWAALDTLVIALLPLRLLEGAKVVGWSRRAWVVLYGLALLAFVHILLRPSTGYVSDTSVSPPSVVIGLFVGFAAFSFAFWGWFRFRPSSSSEPAVGEAGADQVEGATGPEPADVLVREGVGAGEVEGAPVGAVEPAGDGLVGGQAVEPQDGDAV
jgi:hypothetical protein